MIFSIKDFSNFEMFDKTSRKILCEISQNRKELLKLVLDVPENPNLFSKCAHYNTVDKVVLWSSDDQKIQLRLHVYSDQVVKFISSSQVDIAQAHNHRWNFSSYILSGGYRHTIYRIDHSIEDHSIHSLIPVMVHQEIVGNCYTLHHSQYHSIVEEPNTVTLLIRGPLEKERFQVISEKGGVLTSQDGSSLENFEEINQKKMDKERYKKLVDKLISLEII